MRFFWESAKGSGKKIDPKYMEWLESIGIHSDYADNMDAGLMLSQALWKEIQELKK